MYIHCTSVPRIVCIYHYCGCHCILACSTLYRLWHRYIKCYCGGIYHCVQTGIYLLYTPWEWLLRQLIKTCTYIAYICTYRVYTCTNTVHGYNVLYAYIPVIIPKLLNQCWWPLLFLQHLAWHKPITIFWTGTAHIHIVLCIRGHQSFQLTDLPQPLVHLIHIAALSILLCRSGSISLESNAGSCSIAITFLSCSWVHLGKTWLQISTTCTCM